MIKTDEKGNVLEFTHELIGAKVVIQHQDDETRPAAAWVVCEIDENFETGEKFLIADHGQLRWKFLAPLSQALPRDCRESWVCRLVELPIGQSDFDVAEIKTCDEACDCRDEKSQDKASKEASEFLAGLMAEMNDLIDEKIEMAVKDKIKKPYVMDYTTYFGESSITRAVWSDGMVMCKVNERGWTLVEDLAESRRVLESKEKQSNEA